MVLISMLFLSVGEQRAVEEAHGDVARPRLSDRHEPAAPRRPGFSVEAVQTSTRVNVTCVTPLGEEVASTS